MKKLKIIALTLILVLAFPVFTNASITTTACAGLVGNGGVGCQDLSVAGQAHIAIQLTGTWSGTVTFQGTVDNVNFVTLFLVPTTSSTPAGTTTSNGVWMGSVAGLSNVRVVFTAWASGTANVIMRPTYQ